MADQQIVKRERVTDKSWVTATGEDTRDPREAAGFRLQVIGTGDKMLFRPADYSAEIQRALTNFGLDVVLTNTMGGKRGDDAVEAIMTRHETLQAGEWSARKGSEGPRISLLARAVVATYQKSGQIEELVGQLVDLLGTEIDPDDEAAVIEATSTQLKGAGEETRKSISGAPAINAEYKRLQAEAAQERARQAAEAAAAAEGDFAGIDLG